MNKSERRLWKLDNSELWFLLLCYDNYIEDFYNNEDREEGMIPVCLAEFYDNEYQDFFDYYIHLLEEDFAYIDLDNNGNMLEDFYIWDKGTNKKDFEKWVEEKLKEFKNSIDK